MNSFHQASFPNPAKKSLSPFCFSRVTYTYNADTGKCALPFVYLISLIKWRLLWAPAPPAGGLRLSICRPALPLFTAPPSHCRRQAVHTCIINGRLGGFIWLWAYWALFWPYCAWNWKPGRLWKMLWKDFVLSLLSRLDWHLKRLISCGPCPSKSQPTTLPFMQIALPVLMKLLEHVCHASENPYMC